MTACAVIFAVSCGSDGDDGAVNPPPPGCEAEALRLANESLENVLFDLLQRDEDEIDEPDDVDFRAPNGLYHAAFDLNNGCLDARLGIAITDLLVLSTDAEVNDAFDEWNAYLEDRVPFEADASPLRPLGVPIAIGGGADALKLPFDLVPLTLVAHARSRMLGGDPQLERVQAILEERVLPRVESAIGHLDAVGADAGFTFIVTGRMQGDAEEEPAEIDQTDIIALRAACHLLAAAVDVAVAYEINFAAYDSASLFAALQPGSEWLSLRNGGAARMGHAREQILDAVDDVDAAIGALLGEQDSQDDDVIKIGSDAIARADVDSIRDNLPEVRDGLTNGYTRVDDWDDDDGTPAVALTINVGALFQNPVADWKALLPGYQGLVRRIAGDGESGSESGQLLVQVSVPELAYYDAYASISFSGVDTSESFSGYEGFRPEFESFLRSRLALAGSPGGLTYYYVSMSFSGGLDAGTHSAQAYWYETLERTTSFVHIPVLIWDANSFEEWVWPDPTFSGLLPGMTSSDQFLTTFGFDPDDWEKEVEWDWSEVD